MLLYYNVYNFNAIVIGFYIQAPSTSEIPNCVQSTKYIHLTRFIHTKFFLVFLHK